MTEPNLDELTAGVRAMVPIMGAMELTVVDARRGHAQHVAQAA